MKPPRASTFALSALALVALAAVALAGCFTAPAPDSAAVPSEAAAPLADELPAPAPADAVVPITFADLDIGMPANSVYEPWMLNQRVKDLAGRRVRVTGFIYGGIFQLRDIKNFPLLREKECPYGGDEGQAHHVIDVELQDPLTTSFTTRPVTIEGRLTIQPWTGPNGKTWSLYHLEGTRIE